MDPADNKVNLRGKFPEERNRPIRLGGSVLGPPRHICAFFNSHDDEYRVLLPFIKDGFECGEKAPFTPSSPSELTSTSSGWLRRESIWPPLGGVDSSHYVAGPMQTCATRHPYEISTVSLVPMAYISGSMYLSCRGGTRMTYRQS